jgi:hypothetical protein
MESQGDLASTVEKLIAELRTERELRMATERRVGELEREVGLLRAEINRVVETAQNEKRVAEEAAAEATHNDKRVAEAAAAEAIAAAERRADYAEHALQRVKCARRLIAERRSFCNKLGSCRVYI